MTSDQNRAEPPESERAPQAAPGVPSGARDITVPDPASYRRRAYPAEGRTDEPDDEHDRWRSAAAPADDDTDA